jgi:hypothetical protein
VNNACETCRFYSANWNKPSIGQCRRRAPTYDEFAEHARTVWPVVKSNNWCGEHQERAA